MISSHLKRVALRLRRTSAQAIPTIIAVVVLNFALLQLVPGDAADVLAGESGSATAETMAMMRHHFGLDLTLWQQLLAYLNHLAHFSLGFSPRFNTPVMTLILGRLPNTLILMMSALVFAIVAGMIIGVAMANWVGKWPDRVLSFLALVLYSMPGFWLALMAIVLFSVKLGWLPSGGDMTLGVNLTGWSWLVDRVSHAVLPALALASFFVAIYARLTRVAMLEVQRQDYVRTAHAKGLHPFFVTVRHVLRNALLPITTVAGMHLGNLLGGAAVIETVFSWPGLGRLALEAVQGRDYNVLLGVLLLSSMLVIAANVLVDLLHAWLDPRIALH
ncbi:ABC transporter permease [Caballeronia sp. DA-9]|uniref:ABC transporter permease n=1 Tax=Caballeronia sp. DA-9 TaxID=3436237 RepID=UPI003F661C47